MTGSKKPGPMTISQVLAIKEPRIQVPTCARAMRVSPNWLYAQLKAPGQGEVPDLLVLKVGHKITIATASLWRHLGLTVPVPDELRPAELEEIAS